MGGGLFGLIRRTYYEQIRDKEQIINPFISDENVEINVGKLKHINMMCHILLSYQSDMDKSHFIQYIQEIHNILSSIENEE